MTSQLSATSFAKISRSTSASLLTYRYVPRGDVAGERSDPVTEAGGLKNFDLGAKREHVARPMIAVLDHHRHRAPAIGGGWDGPCHRLRPAR